MMNESAEAEHGAPDALETKSGLARFAKPMAVIVVVAALFAASRYFDIQGMLTNALERIEGLGWVGYGLFILLYIAASVFFIPGSILTLGAGAIYGLFAGFLLVSAGSTLGATAAFLVGRYYARDWVASKIEGNERFAAVDKAVAREGWKIVGLTRLSPAFPFSLLNYAYGLTKVSLRDYFFASWIGMVPGTLMYVYLGTVAGTVATLGTEEAPQRSPAQWALLVVGLLATIAVTVYVTKIARNALNEEVEDVDLTAADSESTT